MSNNLLFVDTEKEVIQDEKKLNLDDYMVYEQFQERLDCLLRVLPRNKDERKKSRDEANQLIELMYTEVMRVIPLIDEGKANDVEKGICSKFISMIGIMWKKHNPGQGEHKLIRDIQKNMEQDHERKRKELVAKKSQQILEKKENHPLANKATKRPGQL